MLYICLFKYRIKYMGNIVNFYDTTLYINISVCFQGVYLYYLML